MYSSFLMRSKVNWSSDWIWLAWVLSMVLFQIAGLVAGRINIELPPHRGAETAMASAISIVTGALFGLLVLTLTYCVMAVCVILVLRLR
jgi:hypothetical protein